MTGARRAGARVGAAAALCALAGPLAAAAEPVIAQGPGALELWGTPEARANAPHWVRIWLMVMLGTFAAGLLFVIWRLEARILLAGVAIGMLGGGPLAEALGFPMRSGYVALVHLVCWSPGFALLLIRRPFLRERSLYAAWAALAAAVVAFSFVFDLRDAAIWLAFSLDL